MDRFRLLKRIANAASSPSQIMVAEERTTGACYIIKAFNNGAAEPEECRIIRSLAHQHPNIVNVHDCFACGTSFYMVMPMMGRREMDMFEFIEEHGPLGEDLIVYILRQLTDAIIYLHRRGVAHCDIKVHTILAVFVCLC